MTTTIPEFPMARAARCPFDPPPELRELQEQGPLAKVRLSDGSTAWLVTRYADQRAVLGNPKVSAESDRPGYPNPSASEGESSKISFILMDDPSTPGYGGWSRRRSPPSASRRCAPRSRRSSTT